MRAVVLLFLLWAGAQPAHAHDMWANGFPVPAFVKSACCGPEDVHRYLPGSIFLDNKGWHIPGYNQPVPADHVTFPSADGYEYAFFKTYPDGSQTQVYCIFLIPTM